VESAESQERLMEDNPELGLAEAELQERLRGRKGLGVISER
jgi:hypothetical protein